MRFPLDVFAAVRAAFPAEKPVWIRVSATDWVDGGWDIEGTVALSKALERRGCACHPRLVGRRVAVAEDPARPSYQVSFASRLKREVGIPVIAVGLITEPEQAEAIVASQEADAVSLARAMLYDPRWPWHAAAALGDKVTAPPQYWRSQPREFKDLFAGRPSDSDEKPSGSRCRTEPDHRRLTLRRLQCSARRRRIRRRQHRPATDVVGGLLGQHDGGSVEVAGRDGRHDGTVGDPQAFDPDDRGCRGPTTASGSSTAPCGRSSRDDRRSRRAS